MALSWFWVAGRFFSWRCHGFLLPTARTRGRAVGLLPKPLLARLKLPARASPNKTHGCKNQFLQLLPSRDAQLRPTTRSRNTSSESLGLSAPCAVETAPFAARRSFCRKSELVVGSTFRLCFSSQTLLQSSAFEASSFVRANRAHGCCCWQAFAGHRTLSLLPCLASAARPKFGFLFYVAPATCCGWPLVVGSGWVGLRSKL